MMRLRQGFEADVRAVQHDRFDFHCLLHSGSVRAGNYFGHSQYGLLGAKECQVLRLLFRFQHADRRLRLQHARQPEARLLK